MKQSVVISRHWHSPAIEVIVSDVGISLECSLDDFIAALLVELQHPVMSFTRGRLETNLLTAKDSVLEKLKEASSHVVA
jgi:hypothetical protein